MGESDIVEDVLVNRLGGTLHFGRLNMKPGKPTTFVSIPSQYGRRLVFAMPGNPVSAIVCTQLLVRPCLDMLFRHCGRQEGVPCGPFSGTVLEKEIANMVMHAQVHPEIQATLTHDINLDAERPEYHRVVVAVAPNGSFTVTSTGIQQSSRLMSLRDADGLLVLPKGTADQAKASAGQKYTVLLLRDLPLVPRKQLSESRHLSLVKPGRTFRVGLVQVGDATEDGLTMGKRVIEALSGSKSGSVSIQSCRRFLEPEDRLYDFLTSETDVDFHVISSSIFAGRDLASHLVMAKHLRTRLSKVAGAIALQVRMGAASQDPRTALFETVVGLIPDGSVSLAIFVPGEGLDAGLTNVRGLLKHALEVARSGQMISDHGQT